MKYLLNSDNIQIASFLLLVLIFSLLEHFRPAREISRWKDLKLDLLSFVLAITMNRISYHAVYSFCTQHLPADFISFWTQIQAWPTALKIFVALLITDFFLYWIHRAQHRTMLLWRTHSWHHSIEEMYWFSGFRTSFMHSFIYNIPQTVIPMFVFRLSPWEAGIGYSIGILIQFWEHTNTDIKIGFLKYIFITPAYHRVHHALELRNLNFGTTFSFWDKMFGTYYNPKDLPKDAPLGLGEELKPARVTRMLAGV
jgi:sterol desaturase/sphingolipid hydroxylase (fatty acid hydroxylase superfamily)